MEVFAFLRKGSPKHQTAIGVKNGAKSTIVLLAVIFCQCVFNDAAVHPGAFYLRLFYLY